MFPIVDDITRHLKSIGRGALPKVGPGDYNLLGLEWQGMYVDTCVPFRMHHGRQIYHHFSDTVYMIYDVSESLGMVNYIDNYVGMGVLSVTWASYNVLVEHIGELGLNISVKKLVPLSTQVTYSGILIDTVKGTLAIPPVNQVMRHWLNKDIVSKHQLQSILGLLFYIHKCVKPACVFLNRMLDLLRDIKICC